MLSSPGFSLHMFVLSSISVKQIVTPCKLIGGNRRFEGMCWLHVKSIGNVRMQPCYTRGVIMGVLQCHPAYLTQLLIHSFIHFIYIQVIQIQV
jgi:hypothetical protein